MEKLKKSGIQRPSPPAAEACAGPADVACDFCRGTKRHKATMSCLTCLVSYCPVHLEPHHSVPVLKKHQLVSATIPLQEKMCTKHNKLMEVYCQTDKKSGLCHICEYIFLKRKRFCFCFCLYEQSCSQPAVKICDKIFDELISSIKKKHTLVKQLIKAQEHTAVCQAEELQLQLKDEITKLKIRDTDLEQLSQTDNHIHFIQVADTCVVWRNFIKIKHFV